MIKKAKIWLKDADREFNEYCIMSIKEDEQLNKACFDYHQSLEFALKYMLSCIGVEYGKTHDIGYLIRLIVECNYDGDKKDEINRVIDTIRELTVYADTITNWENKTRYITDFVVSSDLIDQIIPKIRKAIEEIGNIEFESNS